ncbi:purine and other phosphorylase-like protein, family 1 [Dyella solisilvae]|uniref:Purine and other phosphorylase-like protein, family 1 n=2 Tax=Dyella solisilvae TaxID=1920168 RepID=A0A370K4F2_9GAMM|nr:purine and other phosphorylase-like protein, family 1 [Dyella solisilvae]
MEVVAHGDRAMVWLAGMGQDAAREAAQALVEAGATALAVFGVAGALAPGMHSGTLFCPERIVDQHGVDYVATPDWRASLHDQLEAAGLASRMEGILLSLPTPLYEPEAKTSMRDRHQAMAVDMESAGVASVADQHGLPFVVLRAIVDERDDTVPAALEAGIDAWGRLRPLPMLATLARHPGLLGSLPGLATRMRRATRSLRAAAIATGNGLGHEPP